MSRTYARLNRVFSKIRELLYAGIFFFTFAGAFLTLKEILEKAPVLQLYISNRETKLHCYASKEGYGSILLQRCQEGQDFQPIYCMSRKTTNAEKRLHSYELETRAVLRAVSNIPSKN